LIFLANRPPNALQRAKNSKKNLDSSCFVTSFHRILRNYDAMTS
jgi:hypothetical protein